jgi:hypothetical protein
MKAVLHIGTEKTGTTTIQSFLAANRKKLRDFGIVVPTSPGVGNHRLFPAMVCGPDSIDEIFRSRGLLDSDARERAKTGWRDAFRNEMAAVSDMPRCIISSEHLQSRLTTVEDVARLAAFLRELFESVEILLYIRNPIATAVSLYSTAVKYGAVSGTVPGPEDIYFKRIVNHAATIRGWSSVFGEDRLQVRLFERSSFVGGDLIDDFIHACDLPECDYVRPKSENESISAVGLEIYSRMNRKIRPVGEGGDLNVPRQEIVDFFEKYFSAGQRYIPSRTLVEGYETAFAESNEWVRSRYFPERETLFSPYKAPNEQEWLPDDSQADLLAEAFSHLWKKASDAKGK